MNDQVALLLDGGFVTKSLKAKLGHFPSTGEVVALVHAIMKHERLAGSRLFRTYYFDAPPILKDVVNPISRQTIRLGSSESARKNQSLLDSLELEPDFAVRRGSLAYRGWKLGHSALSNLNRNGARALTAEDLIPDLEQKGVDLRIALDIAVLSSKKPVSTLVPRLPPETTSWQGTVHLDLAGAVFL